MALMMLEFGSKLPAGVRKSKLETIAKVVANLELGEKIGSSVVLSFVSKKNIQQLNKQFAGNDYVTDVLSFNYQEIQRLDNEIWGEIVICTDVAKESSEKYGVDIKSEIYLLFIHGLLHLKGMDHKVQADKTRFEGAQSDIIKSLELNARIMKYE